MKKTVFVILWILTCFFVIKASHVKFFKDKHKVKLILQLYNVNQHLLKDKNSDLLLNEEEVNKTEIINDVVV